MNLKINSKRNRWRNRRTVFLFLLTLIYIILFAEESIFSDFGSDEILDPDEIHPLNPDFENVNVMFHGQWVSASWLFHLYPYIAQIYDATGVIVNSKHVLTGDEKMKLLRYGNQLTHYELQETCVLFEEFHNLFPYI